MSSLFPFIIIGLTSGALYGLAATGLVLTYKTSGLFNFGHGAIATIAVYAYYELTVRQGIPWLPSGLIAVFVVGPIVGLLLEVFARHVSTSSTALKIAGTLGIVLAVEGLAQARFGSQPEPINAFLPQGSFQVGRDLTVGYDQVIIIAISLVAVVSLYAFLRLTRLGIAMRAVVDNPQLLDEQGVNPSTVRRTSWVVGSTFAALSGVLLAPNVGLNAALLTLLVVQAFGAAAIGGFSSLPLTYVGGLVIGLATSISTDYLHGTGFIAGIPPSIPFLVLFLVLIITPRARLIDRRVLAARPLPSWRAPARVQVVGGAAVLVILVLLPNFAGTRLTSFTAALCIGVLFLSLGLLTKVSGQVSLAHAGFAAVGAAAFSHLMTGGHVPWLPAVLLAGLIGIPVGAIVALPAIRLSGLYLALATFGFGICLEQMFYTQGFMFTRFTQGVPAPRPHLSFLALDSDKGYYYVALIAVVIAAAVILWIMRVRLGRLLSGMADSPLALSTMGVNLVVTRVMVFCISAYLAAVSGALTASLSLQISGQSFASFSSLTIFVLLAITLGGAPWYALMGGISLYVIPTFFTGANVNNYLNALFGIGAMTVAMQNGATAGAEPLRRLIDRLGGRKPIDSAPVPLRAESASTGPSDEQNSGAIGIDGPATPVTSRPVTSHPAIASSGDERRTASAPVTLAPRGEGLSISDLVVRYGGATAVSGLTLKAPVGRITGLIGPNGAGKTTTFNACSGLVRPSDGTVKVHGRNVASLKAPARARLGLGRTFQKMELFNSLTVRQNISLGVEATMAGSNPLRQVIGRRSERATITERTAWALEACGLTRFAGVSAGSLSTGQRRLVELARCLAGPYDMLLLDEPSSGLDSRETEAFARILQNAVRERGLGILLVEHDMSLVLSVCDYLYVLDFGHLIAEGTPSEIASSYVVREAYLGSDEVQTYVEAREGTDDLTPEASVNAAELQTASAGAKDINRAKPEEDVAGAAR